MTEIRNKKTGEIFEVMPGTLYPSFFEEVKDEKKDEDIIVGEPTVEYEIEQAEEETPKPKKTTRRKTTKRGGKKNGSKRK